MEQITVAIITGIVSLVVGLFGGGGLLKLLQWARAPTDKQREAIQKALEEVQDQLDREREKYDRRQLAFIKRLEEKVAHLEAKQEESGEENIALLAENIRLKAGQPPL